MFNEELENVQLDQTSINGFSQTFLGEFEKQAGKKKITTEKQVRLPTGGGSYNPSPPSSPTPDLDSPSPEKSGYRNSTFQGFGWNPSSP
ncbi:hypothetical protein WDU94_010758 [Cyamophila willieti]